MKEIYSGDGDLVGGRLLIHPICLPPFGPVDWAMISPDSTTQSQETTKPGGSVKIDTDNKFPWMRKGSPMVPFEDMDCVATFKTDMEVPNPTNVKVNHRMIKYSF